MSPRLLRLSLFVFIAGAGLGVELGRIAAREAALVLAAVLVTVWVLDFKFKKLVLVLGLALLLAFVRASLVAPASDLPPVFEAAVVADSAVTAYGSLVTVKTADGQRLRIATERYPEFRSGDIVRVAPARSQPAHGGYVRAELALVQAGQVDSVGRALTRARSIFIESLGRVLPEPQASFAAGTVVGGSSGLPPDLKESITISGLSHILAASGYNFTLLLLGLAFLLRPLALRRQTIILLLAIPAFAIMAGGSPPVLRAGFMAGLASLAILSGRISAAKTAVLWAGAILLLVNPLYIKFDLGWQLSFLSTLGLVTLIPIFSRLTGWELELHASTLGSKLKSGLVGVILATTTAILATMPLLAYTFGNVSLVALPANILTLPVVPAIMISTVAAALGGLFWPLLGQVLALPAWLGSSYILAVAETLSAWPLAQAWLDWPLLLMWLTYIIMAGLVLYLHRRLLRHEHSGLKIPNHNP